MGSDFRPEEFRRGAIWRVAPAPDRLLATRVGWQVERDIYVVVLSSTRNRSHVRVVTAAALDPVNAHRVHLDPTSVELDAGDADVDWGNYVVVDCSNVYTYTDVLFNRGVHAGALRSAQAMHAIDLAIVRGLGLGNYDDFADAVDV